MICSFVFMLTNPRSPFWILKRQLIQLSYCAVSAWGLVVTWGGELNESVLLVLAARRIRTYQWSFRQDRDVCCRVYSSDAREQSWSQFDQKQRKQAFHAGHVNSNLIVIMKTSACLIACQSHLDTVAELIARKPRECMQPKLRGSHAEGSQNWTE